MMDKPDGDTIEGLSPAISIEQKSSSHNPRSTVGTVTEIYDYLRLLYARVGTARCPVHDIELDAMTIGDMSEKIIKEYNGIQIAVLAPIVKKQKGEHIKKLQTYQQQGHQRIRLNKEKIGLNTSKHLLNRLIDPKKKNDIEIIVDRLKSVEGNKQRLVESLETAAKISN